MNPHIHALLGALPYNFFAIFLDDKHKLTFSPSFLLKSTLESISHKKNETTYYHIVYGAVLWLFITIFVSAHVHLHFYTIATT